MSTTTTKSTETSDDHDGDWDEHSSWRALLDDDDDDLTLVDRTSVADRLGPAFAAHHRQGKEYIKHAFIPVLRHTIQLHDAIHNDIFPRRTQGLAQLDNATLRFESAAHGDFDAVRIIYDERKRTLDALFSTLNDLARQNDLLFQAFKTNMHERVQCLRRCTDQMPVDAERLIASLDKKAKHLGAEDHAKAKENFLRDILEKY